MKLIGLTGGIGCGKSFLTQYLKGNAIPVVDTDELARHFLEPGQSSLKDIRLKFGDSMFLANGSLDRSQLSQIIFADPSSKKWLENLLHPLIREAWESEVKAWVKQNVSLGVVVIPLLFETGIQNRFDGIVCMACDAETQNARLAKRGWDKSHIIHRISSQWPLHKKIASSQYIIWTDTTFAGTEAQWDLVHRHLS